MMKMRDVKVGRFEKTDNSDNGDDEAESLEEEDVLNEIHDHEDQHRPHVEFVTRTTNCPAPPRKSQNLSFSLRQSLFKVG